MGTCECRDRNDIRHVGRRERIGRSGASMSPPPKGTASGGAGVPGPPDTRHPPKPPAGDKD